VVGPEIAKVPPEPFRYAAVRAAGWALRSGDVREDAGAPRGWLRDRIGYAPGEVRDRISSRGADRRT